MEQYEQSVTEYLGHLQAARRSAVTIAQVTRMLHNFRGYLQAAGVRDLDGINGDTLRNYIRHLQEGPISRHGRYRRQAGYVRTRLLNLAAFFRHLAVSGRLPADPFADVELPPPEFRLPRNVLTEAEAARLLAAPAVAEPLGLRDRAMMELVYSAGLRPRELIGLDLGEMDTANGRALIRPGKSDPERMISVGETACAWIQRYVAEARPVQLRAAREKALFLSYSGRRLLLCGLGEVINRHARRAGLGRKVGWQTLRYTCAARLLAQGADERVVRALLDPPLPLPATLNDPRAVRS